MEVRRKFIESHMIDSTRVYEFIKFKTNTRSWILAQGLDNKPTLLELTKLLGVNESTLGVYIHLNECEDLVSFHVSAMEQELANGSANRTKNVINTRRCLT